jgi:hypothetical protein
VIEAAYQQAPLLSRTGSARESGFGPPKPVWLSRLMSWAHISGVYSPFTGEPNYNAEQPACDLPAAIAHEKAHQRGFAREDEASFVAFLVCINSSHPYVRYSGYLEGLQVAGALARLDPERSRQVIGELGPGPRADLKARASFWARYQGRVSEMSRQVNHGYLKANRVQSGVRNYHEVAALIIDYYLTYSANTTSNQN